MPVFYQKSKKRDTVTIDSGEYDSETRTLWFETGDSVRQFSQRCGARRRQKEFGLVSSRVQCGILHSNYAMSDGISDKF